MCTGIGAVVVLRNVLRNILTEEFLLSSKTEVAKACVLFAESFNNHLQDPTTNDIKFAEWLMQTFLKPIGDSQKARNCGQSFIKLGVLVSI